MPLWQSKKQESRTHIVGECETHKEQRDVLEEMRQREECDTEKFSTLDSSSEKTIAILGDRWCLQTAKQRGDKISKKFVTYGKNVVSALILGMSLLGVGTVLRLEKDAWSVVT